MADQKSDAFARWQEARNKQLTDVNRLIIGLTTGLLAILNLKADQLNLLSPPQRWSGITSVGLATASLLVGIWLAVNRYESFRITARVARIREQSPAAKDRSVELNRTITQLRAKYKKLDLRSRRLFRLQLFTFFLAVVAFAVMESFGLSRMILTSGGGSPLLGTCRREKTELVAIVVCGEFQYVSFC